MYKSNLAGLGATVAGSITLSLQLGDFPGELVEISEPMSPLSLTCGAWSEPYRTISRHIPQQAGSYILIAEDADGAHVAYVGEGLNIQNRLRTHDVPKTHKILWFAILSSQYPFLSKTHVKAIESRLYGYMERFEGISILGREPGTFHLSAIDAIIVDASVETAKRLLAHAGLPLGLRLPSEATPASDPCGDDAGTETGMMPRTYRTYCFTPGRGTCYADLHAIGSDLEYGFMLHAGSEFRPLVSHKLPYSITQRRHILERSGHLEAIPGVDGRLRLKRSITVSSALVAAKVIAGYAVNDVGVWTPLDGSPVKVH